MSRSALERQEIRRVQQGAVPVVPANLAVYQQAEELQESREVKANELPMHGNPRTFNLNNLLAQNIMQSEYWRRVQHIASYNEVVDEIYSRVQDVGPWATGTSRVPSSAFTLLMRLFVMRLTVKQMRGLLNHQDSPYIRCVGFLYLRYTCPPRDLWSWYEAYIDDPEEFRPVADSALITIGAYVRKLINDIQYYGTTLPRIPVPIERKMKVQMLLAAETQKLAASNKRIAHLLRMGTAVRALYSDEENDPAWYDAVIDSVEADDRFIVSFPEYGNQAEVGLGEIQLPESTDQSRSRSRSVAAAGGAGASGGGGGGGGDRGRDRSRSAQRDKGVWRDRGDSRDRERGGGGGGGRERRRDRSDSRERRRHRSNSRDRDRRRRSRSRDRRSASPAAAAAAGSGTGNLDLSNLYKQVVQQGRDGVTASGKDYAARPTSYKGSLSLKMDRFTHRRKSPSRSPNGGLHRGGGGGGGGGGRRRSPEAGGGGRGRSRSPPRRRDERVTAEAVERMNALKRRYGDASAHK